MHPPCIDLLGSPLHLVSRAQLRERAQKALGQREYAYHFMALNPIKVIRAQRESQLRSYLGNANIVYADAFGICLAAKWLHGVNQERIPGYELHFDILKICEEHGHGVYILGGKLEVLNRALDHYRRDYPNLTILGSHHGYFAQEAFDMQILPEIKTLRPRLVLVAMGALVQEYWIERIRSEAGIPLCLGIGGSLDALVGETPRAPCVMLDLGFEWLYRLVRQPKRWRVMLALPVFAAQTLKARLGTHGNI